MILRFLLANIAISLTAVPAPAFQTADQAKPDTVVVRTKAAATHRIRGTIKQWLGSALTVKVGERTRQIDNASIVAVETTWGPAATRAQELMAAKEHVATTSVLTQAIDAEARPWAQDWLRADLVRCQLASGKPADAIVQFRRLVERDPNTRHLNVAPLTWTGNTGAGSIVGQSLELVTDKNAIVRLIAASWLIDSPHEPAALTALDALSQDLDMRVGRLAAAQIWRTRDRVNPKQLARWRRQVTELPVKLQAGPWFALAEHFSRSNLADDAVAMWMRLPILHANRPDLAAAALYRAARLLHNTNQPDAAAIVRRELLNDYPASSWAHQINSAGSP